MNTQPAETMTTPIDLTLELRSADGTSTEYYQADEERIRKTLRLLSTPRLLTQPQLVLASEQGASTIPCRAIDMILARTSAQVPVIFPLKSPVGLLDITEFRDEQPGEAPAGADDLADSDFSRPLDALISKVEIHTLGGWVSTLKVVAMTRGTVHDQRQSLAHLFDLPVIPFCLKAGGIGLINPNNITRVSAHPTPDALPNTALPMDLLRWTPSRIKTRPNLAEGIHS
jgi:hypothetical protein